MALSDFRTEGSEDSTPLLKTVEGVHLLSLHYVSLATCIFSGVIHAYLASIICCDSSSDRKDSMYMMRGLLEKICTL